MEWNGWMGERLFALWPVNERMRRRRRRRRGRRRRRSKWKIIRKLQKLI
jgi:hypothetical protein